MKQIILKILLLTLLVVSFGQMFGQFTKFDPSKAITIYTDSLENLQVYKGINLIGEDSPIRFILIYKAKSYGGATLRQLGGDYIIYNSEHQTNIKGFNTEKELFDWINSTSWLYADGRKDVRLEPENIIAIYDLSKAKKLEVQLKEEQKVIQKKVEIQEEKWIDREWVRKQNK
jgi:hypothetical protein